MTRIADGDAEDHSDQNQDREPVAHRSTPCLVFAAAPQFPALQSRHIRAGRVNQSLRPAPDAATMPRRKLAYAGRNPSRVALGATRTRASSSSAWDAAATAAFCGAAGDQRRSLPERPGPRPECCSTAEGYAVVGPEVRVEQQKGRRLGQRSGRMHGRQHTSEVRGEGSGGSPRASPSPDQVRREPPDPDQRTSLLLGSASASSRPGGALGSQAKSPDGCGPPLRSASPLQARRSSRPGERRPAGRPGANGGRPRDWCRSAVP